MFVKFELGFTASHERKYALSDGEMPCSDKKGPICQDRARKEGNFLTTHRLQFMTERRQNATADVARVDSKELRKSEKPKRALEETSGLLCCIGSWYTEASGASEVRNTGKH